MSNYMKPTAGFGVTFNPQGYTSGHEHPYDGQEIVDIMTNEEYYYRWLLAFKKNYDAKKKRGVFDPALVAIGFSNVTDDFGVRLGIPTPARRQADKILTEDYLAGRSIFEE